MTSFERGLQRLIDGLVGDLTVIARQVQKEQTKAAVALHRVEQQKALAQERKRDKAERALARKAAREAKKPKPKPGSIAAMAEALGIGRRRPKKPQADKADAPPKSTAKPSAPETPKPAPLFVHKRTREGNIQPLARPKDEAPSSPA
jgi:hypothetical protein